MEFHKFILQEQKSYISCYNRYNPFVPLFFTKDKYPFIFSETRIISDLEMNTIYS